MVIVEECGESHVQRVESVVMSAMLCAIPRSFPVEVEAGMAAVHHPAVPRAWQLSPGV